MLYSLVGGVLCLLASANGFVVAPAAPRTVAVRTADPTMQLGPLSYKLAGAGAAAVVGGVVTATKLIRKKEDPSVTAFRSSLGSMESLSGLNELKLEREEREGRKAGVWKEYVKPDGKCWYYNTETKIQTWIVPDEIKKLDEVSAAARAKNEARGS